MIAVYLNVGLILVVLAIISMKYDNILIVLSKVAEIWECGSIATKFDRAVTQACRLSDRLETSHRLARPAAWSLKHCLLMMTNWSVGPISAFFKNHTSNHPMYFKRWENEEENTATLMLLKGDLQPLSWLPVYYCRFVLSALYSVRAIATLGRTRMRVDKDDLLHTVHAWGDGRQFGSGTMLGPITISERI